MEYSVRTVHLNKLCGSVTILFDVAARDLYALENSRQWSELENFVDGLQTQRNRLDRQETKEIKEVGDC